MTLDRQRFLDSPLGQQLTQTSLNDELQAQGHWQGRYRILMKLGERMPKLDASLQTPAALVSGCESETWLHHAEIDGKHYWLADSQARIVRGLLVLVLAASNGKTASELASLDLDRWFAELGLTDHLSPSRSNGLNAVVEQIKAVSSN
ncbi:SufE family protein [Ferrimonas senticii]|uniref:SufE family protein n=1 Tax=Ferrimonas senticii TaxID=394566 RepID=UPI000415CB50|nr:SufE family protein [Ferrimonas senticii]